MNTNVIDFVGRNANRNARPLPATGISERHDNVVPFTSWFDRARPRRTPTGVFFTTGVLATQGFSA